MTGDRRRLTNPLAVLLAAILIAPLHLPAQGTKKAADPPVPSVKQKSAVRRTSAKSVKGGRRSRRMSYKQRLARLRLQPERVQEIQQALLGAGYLSQEPTGKWDERTRQAMRRYQEDHGFPTTGLPEAKTLMKLGLGPHPLPEDVDPSLTGHAEGGGSPVPSPANERSPQEPSSSPGPSE